MEDIKLQRLKEVLSVPTHSRQEDLMIEYLEKTLSGKGYDYQKDSIGNISWLRTHRPRPQGPHWC